MNMNMNRMLNSHLCTPSTCSLVKPLEESPPPDSWLSVSGWPPLLCELSAGLLRYAPLLAELPFFVNASNKAEEERKKLKMNEITNGSLQNLSRINRLEERWLVSLIRKLDFMIRIQYSVDTGTWGSIVMCC